jgi:hypothetical protein
LFSFCRTVAFVAPLAHFAEDLCQLICPGCSAMHIAIQVEIMVFL